MSNIGEKNLTVTVCLLTWNGEKYLPAFLNSLLEQTFKSWELLVLDNASADKSVSIINEYYPPAKIIRQKQNIGFAKGNNLLIKWSKSDYVLVVNQDIVLEKNYIQTLVDFLEKHPQAGSSAGQLFYWDFDNYIFTDQVDSFGLKIDKRRSVTDWQQGQPGVQVETQEVFGLSGAAVMYRRKALESVKYRIADEDYEYFDEDFFAYKEDIDLAWRLRLWAWENWLVSETKAYHDRTIAQNRSVKDRRLRGLANKLSYRNHIWVLYKNSFFKDLLHDCRFILWYEFKKLIYLMIFERQSLKAWKDFIKCYSKMRKKRKYIMTNNQVKSESINKWFYQ
jgi:GT2 family glycosyltransferase